jgi:hypothetical protein
MEMTHHQPVHREDDDEFICRRCGMINPGDGEPCISAYHRFAQIEESD